MSDDNQVQVQEDPVTTVKFMCPQDGEISRNDVVFLCNHCKQDEMIHKDGIYMCPSCLRPGENFECMLCGSKEVKFLDRKKIFSE